jgi:hypothetical protein
VEPRENFKPTKPERGTHLRKCPTSVTKTRYNICYSMGDKYKPTHMMIGEEHTEFYVRILGIAFPCLLSNAGRRGTY